MATAASTWLIPGMHNTLPWVSVHSQGFLVLVASSIMCNQFQIPHIRALAISIPKSRCGILLDTPQVRNTPSRARPSSMRSSSPFVPQPFSVGSFANAMLLSACLTTKASPSSQDEGFAMDTIKMRHSVDPQNPEFVLTFCSRLERPPHKC